MITGFQVTQQASPTIGVQVTLDSAGAASAMIPSGDLYPYMVFMDAAENITLATADGSNPRIDLIVAYVDLSVVDDTNPNNPGAFLIDNVTGTPSGSPAVPNNAAIQAVIGASNPYIILARVAVAAGATTITNANITDVRSLVITPSYNPYKFRVYKTSAQTLGNDSWDKILFNVEDYDTNGNFDSTTNYRYTVPVDGFYHFAARLSAASTTQLMIAIYKNGSRLERGDHQLKGSGVSGVTYTDTLQAVAGDYFEIYGRSTGGGAMELAATDTVTYFTGFLVSRR